MRFIFDQQRLRPEVGAARRRPPIRLELRRAQHTTQQGAAARLRCTRTPPNLPWAAAALGAAAANAGGSGDGGWRRGEGRALPRSTRTD